MKRIFNRAISLILVLTAVISLGAATNAYSVGYYPSVSWSFDEETGNFTLESDTPSYQSPHHTEWFSIRNKIKSITIKDGVRTIGSYSFSRCLNVTSVKFSKTLSSIGSNAFSSCKFTDIELPGSLEYIGMYAFSNCINLTNVEIPPRVNYIGEGAFYNCTGLNSLKITGKSSSLCMFSFSDCTGLTTISIPKGLSIDVDVFLGCQNIQTVYYTGDEESYRAIPAVSPDYKESSLPTAEVFFNQPEYVYPLSISTDTMPDNTKYYISDELDMTGYKLKVTMSDGTTQILDDYSEMYFSDFDSSKAGNRSFCVEYYGYKAYVPFTVLQDPYGKCGAYTNWKFENKTKTLSIYGEYHPKYRNASISRYGDTSQFGDITDRIKIIKINDGVEIINTNAFSDCINMTDIYIPKSIIEINQPVFEGCNNLEAIHYAGTSESWKEINGREREPALKDVKLYFNGELHSHSYSQHTINEPTCFDDGVEEYICICGDYSENVLTKLEHIPGEWETDDSGKSVIKCTICSTILEEKEENPEQIPDEPESENTDTEEPTEEESIIEQIMAEVVEKISVVIKNAFNFISKLLKIKF